MPFQDGRIHSDRLADVALQKVPLSLDVWDVWEEQGNDDDRGTENRGTRVSCLPITGIIKSDRFYAQKPGHKAMILEDG